MMKIIMKKSISHIAISILAGTFIFLLSGMAHSYSAGNMEELDESGLRDVSGQGLFVADMIRGDGTDGQGNTIISGANEYSTPFNFYRIGMDGEMQMNLNMSKLQLGCGGINDLLSGHAGCDIDIDYVSMMGLEDNSFKPGVPGSPVILDRPYMEFAIKNDDNPTLREVVGVKIGAASVDGFMATGRRYYQGEVNEENLQYAANCYPGDSTGTGVVGCHSGLNTVSGFLGTDLSLTMRVKADVCVGVAWIDGNCYLNTPLQIPEVLGICAGFRFDGNCYALTASGISMGLDAWGCTGRTITDVDLCGSNQADSIFVDLAGTRMQTLGLTAAQLLLTSAQDGVDLVAIMEAIGLNEVYAALNTDARSVHGLAFDNTSDFFLSFQREPIAYPHYSKQSPTQDFIDAGTYGTALDACATADMATARCSSGFAVPANTGWWMNAPSARLVDVYNDNAGLGMLEVGEVLSLLAAPGYLIEHPEFQLDRAQNCYGSSTFC